MQPSFDVILLEAYETLLLGLFVYDVSRKRARASDLFWSATYGIIP